MTRSQGANGSDYLLGEAGNDSLLGGNGDDSMVGAAGNDSFDGGGGFDYVQYGSSDAPVAVNLGLHRSRRRQRYVRFQHS